MRAAISVDVLVVGAGPAGAATAIALASAGRSVALVSRPARARASFGETLSGAARDPLRRLGVYRRFLDDGHSPCPANRWSWGDGALAVHDFVRDARGHAWHLDRERFERSLLDRGTELGVLRYEGSIDLSRCQNGWRAMVSGADGHHSIAARHAVDATGRSAAVARLSGAKRLKEDEQVVLTAVCESAAPSDGTNLVESVEDGWWYSATLPGGRIAACFFTDRDLHGRPAPAQGHWQSLLDRTRYTRPRIGTCLATAPQWRSAGSGRLDRFGGEGWLAVGDAAMTLDPLSSHGLTVALLSALDAASAIGAHLDGDAAALPQYTTRLEAAFAAYAARRRAIYRAEARWHDAPYWLRRHRTWLPGRSMATAWA
jgi:flavin-dependent dehydrogenase